MSHGRSLQWRRSRGGPIVWVSWYRGRAKRPLKSWLFSTNCDATVSLKAKTSRSNGAHYGQHVDLIPQYAAELVKARVDVIVATGEQAIRAVQQATKTIPIVAIAGDMLGSGLVNSLARPEGNTTGVSILALEAEGKRQDILIEAVPGLRLMAVLTDVNYTNDAKLDALQEAARAHNIEFSIHRVARARGDRRSYR